MNENMYAFKRKIILMSQSINDIYNIIESLNKEINGG